MYLFTLEFLFTQSGGEYSDGNGADRSVSSLNKTLTLLIIPILFLLITDVPIF